MEGVPICTEPVEMPPAASAAAEAAGGSAAGVGPQAAAAAAAASGGAAPAVASPSAAAATVRESGKRFFVCSGKIFALCDERFVFENWRYFVKTGSGQIFSVVVVMVPLSDINYLISL